MERREVSIYLYTSLAGSCVRDLRAAVNDAEDTMNHLAVKDAGTSLITKKEQTKLLRELKKDVKELVDRIRSVEKLIAAQADSIDPKRTKRDERQLALPHT